jgi:hypothetical protein
VAFHDLLTDRQPNTTSGILALVVQTLKRLKNALEVLRVDADTVPG